MRRYLIHSESGQRLELSDRADCIVVDGNLRKASPITVALLRSLIRDHPSGIDRQAISALLLEHHRAPDLIPKAMMDLRGWLNREGLPDLVETQYGRGYGLSEDWDVEEDVVADAQVLEAIEELRQLYTETNEKLANMPFRDTAAGAQFVSPPPGYQSQAFTRFHEAAWRLLYALSAMSTTNGSLIAKLKSELFLLLSYVIYWRIGTRYAADIWREEFRRELNTQWDVVLSLIASIVEGSRQQTRATAKSESTLK